MLSIRTSQGQELRCGLNQIDEVAAGIFEHCRDDRAEILRLAQESNAPFLQASIFCIHVAGDECGSQCIGQQEMFKIIFCTALRFSTPSIIRSFSC
jgi:hypothetical protein